VPDALATLAYDAANITLTAINQAKSTDPAVVKDTLAKITYSGVSGKISYDPKHNPIKSAVILAIKDGKITFKETVAPAAPAAAPAPQAAGGITAAESQKAIDPALAQGVKFAIVAPMTGDVSTFGLGTKNGAEMAFNEWNKAGAKIEWVIGDDRCDPQEARNAANKVIDQDGVKFIIGGVCSSASIPVSEVANPKKVPEQPDLDQPAGDGGQGREREAVHLPGLLHRPVPGDGGRSVCPEHAEGEEGGSLEGRGQ